MTADDDLRRALEETRGALVTVAQWDSWASEWLAKHPATPPAEGLPVVTEDGEPHVMQDFPREQWNAFTAGYVWGQRSMDAATPPGEGHRINGDGHCIQWYEGHGVGYEKAMRDAATPPAEGLDVERVGRDAIGLFIEYRDKHGRDEVAALEAAVQEVVEGAALAPEQPDELTAAERIMAPFLAVTPPAEGLCRCPCYGCRAADHAPEQPE